MVYILERYIKKCRVNHVNEKIYRSEVAAGRLFCYLNKLQFFMVYPYLKLHILFYSNVLAIWSGFLEITHITKKMVYFGRHDLVSVRVLPKFELIRAISEMDVE